MFARSRGSTRRSRKHRRHRRCSIEHDGTLRNSSIVHSAVIEVMFRLLCRWLAWQKPQRDPGTVNTDRPNVPDEPCEQRRRAVGRTPLSALRDLQSDFFALGGNSIAVNRQWERVRAYMHCVVYVPRRSGCAIRVNRTIWRFPLSSSFLSCKHFLSKITALAEQRDSLTNTLRIFLRIKNQDLRWVPCWCSRILVLFGFELASIAGNFQDSWICCSSPLRKNNARWDELWMILQTTNKL